MRVDTHMHAYSTAEQGLFETGEYAITEYGDKSDVLFSDKAGTVDDVLRAMVEADIDYAVILGSFELPELPFPPERARFWPEDPVFAAAHDDLVDYNRWLCDVGKAHPQLLPFVTVNPAVMTSGQSARHIREMIDGRGARGLKLHNIAIRTFPDDPGLTGTFEVAQEAGVPIVVHCGPDARGRNWAVPTSFIPVAEAFPRLKLVVAHLGGAAWREVPEIARDFPQLWFDLSETVAWLGASRAARPNQLVELIRSVGIERVVTGSDFPWYEPSDTVDQVLALPGLSEDAKQALLGGNAARLLSLD